MSLQTILTNKLRLRHPIVAAPLGRGSTPEFLGALAREGSFGFVALGHMPVAEANVLSSSEPVFGLVFAWLLLRDSVSPWETLGAAVIITSCVLVSLKTSKMRGAPAPAPTGA